jgi:hypothetical protein
MRNYSQTYAAAYTGNHHTAVNLPQDPSLQRGFEMLDGLNDEAKQCLVEAAKLAAPAFLEQRQKHTDDSAVRGSVAVLIYRGQAQFFNTGLLLCAESLDVLWYSQAACNSSKANAARGSYSITVDAQGHTIALPAISMDPTAASVLAAMPAGMAGGQLAQAAALFPLQSGVDGAAAPMQRLEEQLLLVPNSEQLLRSIRWAPTVMRHI